MRLLHGWWFATACMVVLSACGGGRSRGIPCGEDGGTVCEDEYICLRGYCTATDQAQVSASAEAFGAAANIYVIDALGNVCEARECADLPYGSRVTFRVEPVAGARFAGWSGSPECTGEALDLVIETLTRDTHCIANFVTRLEVTAEVLGVEGGGATVTSASPTAQCMDNRCEVDAGTTVRIEAMDRWGERFVGWSGEGCGAPGSLSRVIEVIPREADIACTATFQPRVSIGGKAMGVEATIEVTSPAQFRACEPGSCVIDRGESAILSAPAIAGYRFGGWSGTDACAGDQPRLLIENVSESQTCLATYLHRFTVAGSSEGASPPPALTAVSSDQYASCSGSACEVDKNGSVTLLAWSAPGYRLDSWSGPGCGMDGGAALEIADVTSDLACVANYVPGIAVIGAVVGAPGDVTASSPTPGATCAGSRCVIPPNGSVTLQAPTIEGYRFQRWKGEPGCEGSELALTFAEVTESRTCEAEYFSRYVVRGRAAPSEGGVISASSENAGAACRDDSCTLDAGGEVRLEAAAAEGYRFSGWSGGGACTGGDSAITVSNIVSNVSCQANFVVRASVTGIPSPDNGGRVEAFSDSGGADCVGATCTVDEGSRVDLMATPAMGYAFAGWSDCADSRERALRIDDVQRAIVCRASFVPLRFTVSSTVTPDSGGTVGAFSSDSAAACERGRCVVNYGSNVQLTANPAPGYRFASWSGCSNGSDPVITLRNVQADQRCGARFERVMISASASASPPEGGQVSATSSSPDSRCSGARCEIPYGGAVTFTATPSRGYRFTDWSGCGTSAGATLQLENVTSARSCRANFELTRWAVSGTASPSEGGSVSATSSNGSCSGGRCSVDFGADVTLVARASEGFRFTSWSGCQGTNASLTVRNVRDDVTCTANFARVSVRVIGVAESGGTLIAPCSGARCAEDVNQGGSVTFTARPNAGFMFTGWSGAGCAGSGLNATVSNVQVATTCTARFEPIPPPRFEVTGFAGTGGVLTAPCTGQSCTVDVVQGGSITFTARPNADFTFAGWSGVGCRSDGLSVTVSNVQAATTCRASFESLPPRVFTVTGVAETGGSLSAPCEGSPCPRMVIEGGSVTFTAQPNAGFMFLGWRGTGCIASGNNVTVSNVQADTTCTASFEREPTPTFLIAGRAESGGSLVAPCSGSMCSENVTQGGSITFTARPDEGFMFVGWSGAGCVGAGLSATVSNVQAATTCTASFAPIPPRVFTVTGVAGPGGSLAAPCTESPCPRMVTEGGSATFTAQPNAGFMFVRWTGPRCIASGNDVTVSNVQADATCTASFERIPPATVTVTGVAEAGGVLTAPCAGSSCTVDVVQGGSVTFTAQPNPGFMFAGWSGSGCTGSGLSATVSNAQAATTCTAGFEAIPPRMFTITGVAEAGGSLAAPCQASPCPRSVIEGGSVTFTAQPDAGFMFVRWRGAGCIASGNNVTVSNVQVDTTCTASFEREPTPTFLIAGRAESGGSLVAPCSGSMCSENVPQGGSITFTARPDAGFMFAGWSGVGCVRDGLSATVSNVQAATTCTASFERIPPTTVTVTGVAGLGGSLAAPCLASPCRRTVTVGDDVTFTAQPDAGFTLASWTGAGCVRDGLSATVSDVRTATTCTAAFEPVATQTFLVTAEAGPGGTLTAPCIGTTCSLTVERGDDVTFNALPDAGYTFDGWSGDCPGRANPASRNNVQAALSCRANFRLVEPEPPTQPGGGIVAQ